MKKDSKQFLLTTFLILYALSVFLDLHIFYNSISTLIRMGFLGIYFIIIFFKYSKAKERKSIYIYLSFFTLFMVFHLVNINNNVALLEILYLFKMSMHVFVIYIVYKLGIKLSNFYKVLNVLLLIICGQIVVCNVFKLGYESATFNTINYNFLNWFSTVKYYPNYLTGKGYFSSANQIIAIVMLYLPLLISKLKEKTNIFNVFMLAITIWAMFILGNRTSTFGPLIILGASLIIYIILLIFRKETVKIGFFAVLILFIGLDLCVLMVSPGIRRNKYYEDFLNNNLDGYIIEETPVREDSDEYHEVIIRWDNSTIMDEVAKSVINKDFYNEIYPYSEDPLFWADIIQYDDAKLIDSRFLELMIIKRIKVVNNNRFFDSLLGLGYNRLISVVNVEKDYVMQYYSIGILGSILFLGVYIILYIKLGFKIAFNVEKKLTYANLMLMLSIGLVLIIAYFSGNLLNSISIILPLSTVLGIAYNEIGYKDKRNILGYEVNSYTKEEILYNINKDIKDKRQNVMFNLNPLIMLNFYKNKRIIEEFNKQKYNIVDGVGAHVAAKIKDNDSHKIAGVEMMEDILLLAKENGYKVYLYGATKESLKKCQKEIEKKYKGINIVGSSTGYVDEKDALKDINSNKPEILFVAMGSPKQEMFILQNKDNLKCTYLIMPVGGSFDAIGKTVKRAPVIWRVLRLEWLYRMIKEPRRFKKLGSLVKFVILVIFNNSCYNK